MVKGEEYVTIATDISASKNICTWACYIRTPKQSFKHVALFKTNYKTGGIAETRALANALILANQLYPLEKANLIVYSDDENILTYKKCKDGTPRKAGQRKYELLSRHVLPLLQKAKTYDVRHVKAHTGRGVKPGEDPARFWMNRWCDLESRRLMRETLKERQHQPQKVNQHSNKNRGVE